MHTRKHKLVGVISRYSWKCDAKAHPDHKRQKKSKLKAKALLASRQLKEKFLWGLLL